LQACLPLMQLHRLNALDRGAAEHELLRCCGSERWAREMAMRRPWPDLEAMAEDADTIWRGLSAIDRLQAFAAHPQIGVTAATAAAGAADRRLSADAAWSSQEQSRVMAASDDLRDRLAAANDRYQARFGFIFIVCATGKSAEEMLAIVLERLTHSREEELRIAAEEQRKITRLRLKKLVSE
jgi:OHCU decarboxylase